MIIVISPVDTMVHANYNLNYKNSFYIPITISQFIGLIIKEIAIAYGNIDVLSITKKKYISFTKHVDSSKDKNNFHKNCLKLRFIDSSKFLNSLDKLVARISIKIN